MFATRCKHCKVKFTAEERGKRLHQECIDPWMAEFAEKQKRKAIAARTAEAKKERAETRQRKEALKRLPDYIKEAQIEFNKFCRERDRQAGWPCISSGRVLDWSGNGVDAGHYRSVGAAGHLRFDERNCHAQSKHDNQWKSGNVVEYRINLIKRIGLEAVVALESDNTPRKWTREELIAIRDTYRAKLKQLKASE